MQGNYRRRSRANLQSIDTRINRQAIKDYQLDWLTDVKLNFVEQLLECDGLGLEIHATDLDAL
jgi:hypothetical protein